MNILILGGYGNVGSMIARLLVQRTSDYLIIAGRRYAQAQKTADELGERAIARKIDVSVGIDYDAALWNVDLAVVCFDLPDDHFLRACLERGIDYVDISAEPAVLSRVEALDNLAREHEATALISVGLMPGISNLMAKRGVEQFGEAQRVDNVALLGLGEAFGSASADWTIRHLGDRYAENRIRIDMGEGFGMRTAYRFAFADEDTIPKTLSVNKVASWVCYDRTISTHLIGLLRFLRLGWLFRNASLRRWLVSMVQKSRFGSDVFVLTSRVTGYGHDQTYQSWLKGQGEADVTARVAAETIHSLVSRSLPVGVHHLEQIFKLNPYLVELSQFGVKFEERS